MRTIRPPQPKAETRIESVTFGSLIEFEGRTGLSGFWILANAHSMLKGTTCEGTLLVVGVACGETRTVARDQLVFVHERAAVILQPEETT